MITCRYPVNKKEILFIVIIFVLALALRLAYFADYSKSDIYPVLAYSDSYSYFLWAKDIAGGDILGSQVFMKWPLYAYFLAFLLKISRNSIAAVYFFQYLLGALNCVLIYLIGKKIFNKRTGFVAAILCACYGPFIFYDSLLMYVTLSLFLNSLFFLFLLNIQDAFSRRKLFCLGVFFGICLLAQANTVFFGIAAVLWIIWNRRLSFAKSLYYFSLFLAGLVIVIGSVTLRNYLVGKDAVLISGNIGLNYYLGNNPKATGTFFCPTDLTLNQQDMFRDAKVIAEAESGRRLKTSQVSSFWFKKSFSFIKSSPKAYAKLLLKKVNYLFNASESIHDLEYYSLKDKIRIFKRVFLDLRFLLPLGLLGIFLGLRKFRETALLYFAIIGVSLGIILFFVSTRYRVSLVPILAIFASYGIFGLWETIREKKYLTFILFCAALVLLFNLSYRDSFRNDEDIYQSNRYEEFFMHFQKAQRLIGGRDYPAAMKELKLAERIEPDNKYIILSLGVVNYRMENFKRAEEEFKKLIWLFPLYVDAYYNLGFLYNQEKRFKEAGVILEKAVSLDPESPQLHFELGRAYKAMGKSREAKEEFSAALQRINRWRSEEIAMIEDELKGIR